MHSLFLKKYPELGNKVKYEYYLKYFKENFQLRFGRPQVDVCSLCEELGTKLRNPNLNDNAKRVVAAELMVHKRRAKKFYNKLQEVQKLCKDDTRVAGITFDYMQNLPLPNIPVQDFFYYRQLWVYLFEIHNLTNSSGYCIMKDKLRSHQTKCVLFYRIIYKITYQRRSKNCIFFRTVALDRTEIIL